LAGKLILEQWLFVDRDRDILGALLCLSILLGGKLGLVASIFVYHSGHYLIAIIEGLQHMPPAQTHSWNTVWMHKIQRKGIHTGSEGKRRIDVVLSNMLREGTMPYEMHNGASFGRHQELGVGEEFMSMLGNVGAFGRLANLRRRVP
jgi:hypothetical protein